MDPVTTAIASAVDWQWLLREFGYPTVVSFFLLLGIVAVVISARKEKAACEARLLAVQKACENKLNSLRSYTDKSLEGMRKMQNQERDSSMQLMNTLAHDVTNVLSQLLSEMEKKREQEEKTSADIIAHIDTVIKNRGSNDLP